MVHLWWFLCGGRKFAAGRWVLENGVSPMVCDHLRQLYQLCLEQKIRLSASDLIHVVCEQCGRQEVCPSNLVTSLDEPESPASPPGNPTGRPATPSNPAPR